MSPATPTAPAAVLTHPAFGLVVRWGWAIFAALFMSEGLSWLEALVWKVAPHQLGLRNFLSVAGAVMPGAMYFAVVVLGGCAWLAHSRLRWPAGVLVVSTLASIGLDLARYLVLSPDLGLLTAVTPVLNPLSVVLGASCTGAAFWMALRSGQLVGRISSPQVSGVVWALIVLAAAGEAFYAPAQFLWLQWVAGETVNAPAPVPWLHWVASTVFAAVPVAIVAVWFPLRRAAAGLRHSSRAGEPARPSLARTRKSIDWAMLVLAMAVGLRLTTGVEPSRVLVAVVLLPSAVLWLLGLLELLKLPPAWPSASAASASLLLHATGVGAAAFLRAQEYAFTALQISGLQGPFRIGPVALSIGSLALYLLALQRLCLEDPERAPAEPGAAPPRPAIAILLVPTIFSPLTTQPVFLLIAGALGVVGLFTVRQQIARAQAWLGPEAR